MPVRLRRSRRRVERRRRGDVAARGSVMFEHPIAIIIAQMTMAFLLNLAGNEYRRRTAKPLPVRTSPPPRFYRVSLVAPDVELGGLVLKLPKRGDVSSCAEPPREAVSITAIGSTTSFPSFAHSDDATVTPRSASTSTLSSRCGARAHAAPTRLRARPQPRKESGKCTGAPRREELAARRRLMTPGVSCGTCGPRGTSW